MGMTLSGLIVLCVSAASAADPLYGTVPEDVPTFLIQFSDKKQAYGAIRLRDDWCRVTTEPDESVSQIEIVFDTPWEPREPFRGLRSRVVSLDYQPSALRRSRLESGWGDAGYLFVETPQGKRPIHTREIEYAKRAQALEEALRRAVNPPADAAQSQTPGPSESLDAPPGSLEQWGAQIALAITGMALAALVFRALVMRREKTV